MVRLAFVVAAELEEQQLDADAGEPGILPKVLTRDRRDADTHKVLDEQITDRQEQQCEQGAPTLAQYINS